VLIERDYLQSIAHIAEGKSKKACLLAMLFTTQAALNTHGSCFSTVLIIWMPMRSFIKTIGGKKMANKHGPAKLCTTETLTLL
jgi:hypothetical protein